MENQLGRRDFTAQFRTLSSAVESGLPAVAGTAEADSLVEPGTGLVKLPPFDASKTVMSPKVIKKDMHLKVGGCWAAFALPPEQE
jgi:hypothetical protein